MVWRGINMIMYSAKAVRNGSRSVKVRALAYTGKQLAIKRKNNSNAPDTSLSKGVRLGSDLTCTKTKILIKN